MLTQITLAVIASEGGNGGLLDVNPGLMIWTVITFIILLFILKRVAWKPILTALDKRENDIKESLAQAEKARDEAKQILEENQANLAKAEDESRKIIEQSRTYAESLKEQLMRESKEQAKKIVDDASSEIQRNKDAAFEELKGQIAEIAVGAAEKIIRDTLDAQKSKQVIDKYLNDVTKN
ncbi:MAG: F0F1 ATP synthase subunit B [Ignavibacteriaceae bacterium]|jgi:F-type H+-transporting ATPase subunit b|nr:F0F1 ATP synthase subunit B [Ignavibacteriaceae bacterium]